MLSSLPRSPWKLSNSTRCRRSYARLNNSLRSSASIPRMYNAPYPPWVTRGDANNYAWFDAFGACGSEGRSSGFDVIRAGGPIGSRNAAAKLLWPRGRVGHGALYSAGIATASAAFKRKPAGSGAPAAGRHRALRYPFVGLPSGRHCVPTNSLPRLGVLLLVVCHALP